MDVKTLCLGVLTRGDASGYEIKKQFEEGPFAHFHAAGFGSIYPALGKLSAEGLVTCTQLEQEGRPDKKVYSITPAGMAAFKKALHRKPRPDKIRSEYMFMLFFGHLLEPGHRQDIVDGVISDYRRMAECLGLPEPAGLAAGQRFVRGLGRTFYESVAAYMEENKHLLFDGEPASRTLEPSRRTGTDQ